MLTLGVTMPLDSLTLSSSLSQGISPLILGMTAMATNPPEVNHVLGQ